MPGYFQHSKPSEGRLTIQTRFQSPAAGQIIARLNNTEAIEIAREWVDRYAAGDPGFRGAHLMGGITHARRDAIFPAYSDLDVMLVVDRPTITKDPIDELYRGISIEAGIRDVEQYASPETVLANPEVADHIAVGAIVADPVGLLGAIQPVVAREFARRRWVALRCEDEKRRYEMYLNAARLAQSPVECILPTILAVQNLASLVAVALLVPPTHRKSLVLLRTQLATLERPDLFETALAAAGIRDFSKARVEWYLDQAAVAFDRALEVRRTPVAFDFKLRPHLRPYLLDGSQSMIDAGDHREAMPWIAAGILVTAAVLLNDAPDDEKPRYAAVLHDLVEDLGWATDTERGERFDLTVELAHALFELADVVVGRRPDDLVTA